MSNYPLQQMETADIGAKVKCYPVSRISLIECDGLALARFNKGIILRPGDKERLMRERQKAKAKRAKEALERAERWWKPEEIKQPKQLTKRV